MELGKGSVLEPFLSSAIFARRFVADRADAAARQAAARAASRRAHLHGGALRARLALRHRCVEPRARLQKRRAIVLAGHKAVVIAGDAADMLLVSARTADGAREEGVTLFVVEAKQPGVMRRISHRRRPARRRHVLAKRQGARRATSGRVGRGLAAIEGASDIGLRHVRRSGGRDAGAVRGDRGVLQTRQQFGATDRALPSAAAPGRRHGVTGAGPIDELSRGAALYVGRLGRAPSRLVGGQGHDRRRGRFVGQQAVQLHGGMGMTDELKASH